MTLEQPTLPLARTRTRPPVSECVVRGCPNDEKTRGLCGTCYASAGKAVKAGKVTWAWLVSQGLAKPLRGAQSQSKGLFGAQLEGAIAANPPQPLYTEDSATQDALAAGRRPPWPVDEPTIPGPEAAHAAADGPPPPVATDAPPPAKAAPAIVQVDPETGKPYVHPPVEQPAPAVEPAPQPTTPPIEHTAPGPLPPATRLPLPLPWG